MTIICFFFPALLFGLIRTKYSGESRSGNERDKVKGFLVNYVIGCMLVNWIIWVVLAFVLKNDANYYDSIMEKGSFAAQYLLLAVFLAILLPVSERLIRERRVSFQLGLSFKKTQFKYWRLVVTAYTVILFLMNFIRIFDNNFWGDECFSRVATLMDFKDMLAYCADHVPLHYILVWAAVRAFGYSGWVFHMVSLVPYVIGLILALTIIWKWFGKEASIIYVSFSSLLFCAVRYNVEVRMYSWCALFILLVYLTTYQIYRTEKLRYFIPATFFAAGAEYSHNFALACMAILYFVLFLYAVVKKNLKLTVGAVLSGIMALGLYAPWILFQRQCGVSNISNYGITSDSIWMCIGYIFQSSFSQVFLLLLALLVIVYLVKNIRLFKAVRREDGTYQVSILCRDISISSETIWILSGIAGSFGTILAAWMFSYLFYPILLVRYVYAVYVIAWLLFGILVGKSKYKEYIAAGVVLLILAGCLPRYISTFKTEFVDNQLNMETIDTLDTLLDEDSLVLTDGDHLAWTILASYYPDIDYQRISLSDLPEMQDENTQYWLMLVEELPEETLEALHSDGKDAEIIVNRGLLGENKIWVYKVVEKN